ncbi:acyltransferase [Siphonobacter sp. SORGH_AS_1065]|uniref:acyltransferase n=1 Tax=Siphonobacter sp. SORGH_AS_1065 TaxID=3041795 RepID=UPI002782DA47|nr:acyltransferase [Siphonobacter sp. SORGH_AS_1065]MDQ1089043.1 acetyltransferase-like isoleucine patch superfamily enzyme [Siphonobacter sp. SORGH_AS_1065]
MKRYLNILSNINLQTIRFNFKYFPFKQAIRFPIYVAPQVHFNHLAGQVSIEGHLWPGKIKIGYGEIGIFDKQKSRSIWQVSGNVVFKGACNIGHGSKISVGDDGTLIFGDNFTITAETSLICYRKIEFGANCVLSWEILMMDTDLHTIKNSQGEVINYPKPIRVGDNVWIGCRSTILKGSTVSNDSIIAAGSLVTKPLEGTKAIFGGSPVRILKENVRWEV